MKRIAITALIILLITSQAHAASFIDALAMQESGNKPLEPRKDVNGALVIGYFQITKAYWQDAAEFDKSLNADHGGSWERCQNDREYSISVINAYMRRYCPEALKTNNYEVMARTHNGGPSGAKKNATVTYWKQVKARMEK